MQDVGCRGNGKGVGARPPGLSDPYTPRMPIRIRTSYDRAVHRQGGNRGARAIQRT